MIPAPLSLADWYRTSVRSELGFSAASGTPEPVHVLNAFLRQVYERTDPPSTDLAAYMARSVDEGDVRSLVKDLGAPTLPSKSVSLAALQSVTAGLLNADASVYRSRDMRSFNLAHPGYITADPSDSGIGEFAAKLAWLGNDPTAALQAILDGPLSGAPVNPVAALSSLYMPSGSLSITVGGALTDVAWLSDPDLSAVGLHLASFMRRLLTTAAQLEDGLEALQLVAFGATWSAVMAFIHVANVRGNGETPVVLVAASRQQELPTIAESSHLNSYQRTVSGFMQWVQTLFREHLDDVFEVATQGTPSAKDLRRFVASAEPFSKSKTAVAVAAQQGPMFDRYYTQFAGTADAEMAAAAAALSDALEATMNNPPHVWLKRVARSCGFLGPRRGKGMEMFVAEPALLPVLVIAGLDDDRDTLPFDQWSSNLSERFGISFGPERALNLSPAPAASELDANNAALIAMLVRTGLAEQYSDAVAAVVKPGIAA